MPGRIAQLTLLSVTVLGTMCNNIINVPLRSIAADLRSTPSAAVLCVSAFVLMLAIALPISDWLGDRVGQKQTLVAALLLMLVTQALAAFAPNLAALMVLRGVQGLACSAIPPIVMGLLRMFYPERGLSVMGSWAAANGVGQAIGPATGGLISDAWGWRMIFVVLGAACLAVLVLTWLFVPAVAHRSGPFDVRGAHAAHRRSWSRPGGGDHLQPARRILRRRDRGGGRRRLAAVRVRRGLPQAKRRDDPARSACRVQVPAQHRCGLWPDVLRLRWRLATWVPRQAPA